MIHINKKINQSEKKSDWKKNIESFNCLGFFKNNLSVKHVIKSHATTIFKKDIKNSSILKSIKPNEPISLLVKSKSCHF